MSDTLSLDQLEQLLETMTPAEIRARYAEALAANPRCDAMLGHFEQMDEKLAVLADAEPAPPLPDFAAVQAKRTDVEAKVVPLRRRSLRWLVTAGPIAAALVVALLIARFWPGEGDLLRVPGSELAVVSADQDDSSPGSLREESVSVRLELEDESLARDANAKAAAEYQKLEVALEEQVASRANGFGAEEGSRLKEAPATVAPAPDPVTYPGTGLQPKDEKREAKMDREQPARSADRRARVGGAASVKPKPTDEATIPRIQNDRDGETVDRAAAKAKKTHAKPEPAKEPEPLQNEMDGGALLADRDTAKPAETLLSEAMHDESRGEVEADKAVAAPALPMTEAGEVAEDVTIEQQLLAEVAEAEAESPGYQAASSPRLAQKQIALQGIEEAGEVMGVSRSRRADTEKLEIGPLALLLLRADGGNRAAVAQLGETRARRLTELENAWQTSETAPTNLISGLQVLWPVFDAKPLSYEQWQQAWRASSLASRPAVWLYPRRWRGDRRLLADVVFDGQTRGVLILFHSDRIELRRP